MRDDHRNTDRMVLAYFCLVFLIYLISVWKHLIFRKYLRILNGVLMIAGLGYFLFRGRERFKEKKKRILITALIGIFLCFLLLCLFLRETDKETAVTVDGEKKIRRESSFIMYYQETYYDYQNPFWYHQYPCIEVHYDDGDPDQWIYTDHYDETGTLVRREFAE